MTVWGALRDQLFLEDPFFGSAKSVFLTHTLGRLAASVGEVSPLS
jgi:hypothetical protein